jgi:hypothetical protein
MFVFSLVDPIDPIETLAKAAALDSGARFSLKRSDVFVDRTSALLWGVSTGSLADSGEVISIRLALRWHQIRVVGRSLVGGQHERLGSNVAAGRVEYRDADPSRSVAVDAAVALRV